MPSPATGRAAGQHLSLVGFLAGGALGMWLLPQLLERWTGVGGNVRWHTVLLVSGVFVLASVGQAPRRVGGGPGCAGTCG